MEIIHLGTGQIEWKMWNGVKRIAIGIFENGGRACPKSAAVKTRNAHTAWCETIFAWGHRAVRGSLAETCLKRIPNVYVPYLKIVRHKLFQIQNVFCRSVAHVAIEK